MKRVFLIVLDSFGIGAMPDSAGFGDAGADTLGSVRRSPCFCVPVMREYGLLNIEGLDGGVKSPKGAYARMTEASRGKDTIIGHWEMCGVVSERDLPVYPAGFPKSVIDDFERLTGHKTLCNLPYSGTKVIADYGKEHVRTGKLIVYTSADSVFQVAAHEDVVPVRELYRCCEIAREMLRGEHGVGRVIARPFAGDFPYTRTAGRHDYALPPPHETLMDLMRSSELDTIAVGKIGDIFAGRGIGRSVKTDGNADGMRKTKELLDADFHGLAFINLVDFDMLYGHRRDTDGYAAALTEFDRWLGEFIPAMRFEDLLMITGDHGCDPGFRGTDHTREYTPLLAAGRSVRPADLGTRQSFADIGATAAEFLGIEYSLPGKSFLPQILRG